MPSVSFTPSSSDSDGDEAAGSGPASATVAGGEGIQEAVPKVRPSRSVRFANVNDDSDDGNPDADAADGKTDRPRKSSGMLWKIARTKAVAGATKPGLSRPRPRLSRTTSVGRSMATSMGRESLPSIGLPYSSTLSSKGKGGGGSGCAACAAGQESVKGEAAPVRAKSLWNLKSIRDSTSSNTGTGSATWDIDELDSVEEHLDADPDCVFQRNRDGHTLLHCGCSLYFTRHLDPSFGRNSLEFLSSEIEQLVTANPDAARQHDQWPAATKENDRQTPLDLLIDGCFKHACECQDLDRQLLRTLMLLFAAETVDKASYDAADAADRGRFDEASETLLASFQRCVGSLPSLLHGETAGGYSLLSIAIIGHAPLSVIEWLLDEMPSKVVAARADSVGRMPLHHGAAHGRSGDVILRLLLANPDAASIVDEHGYTPLCVAGKTDRNSLL